MKNLIRQILREETSGLTDEQIKAGYDLMNMITKGYKWYTDTPERPFEYGPGSIWLINPDTNKWMLELAKSGRLWYYGEAYDTFSMYLNMEESDIKSFIKIWVKDVLKKRVVSAVPLVIRPVGLVEYVLKNGKQLK